jgi:quinol monooxygenase YgiN
MIAVIATLTIRPGEEAAFEAAATALAAAVRANEPGCALYTFVKSRTDAAVYTVMELYQTEADMTAHGQSEHFKALSPALGATLAGRPAITVHDVVV